MGNTSYPIQILFQSTQIVVDTSRLRQSLARFCGAGILVCNVLQQRGGLGQISFVPVSQRGIDLGPSCLRGLRIFLRKRTKSGSGFVVLVQAQIRRRSFKIDVLEHFALGVGRGHPIQYSQLLGMLALQPQAQGPLEGRVVRVRIFLAGVLAVKFFRLAVPALHEVGVGYANGGVGFAPCVRVFGIQEEAKSRRGCVVFAQRKKAIGLVVQGNGQLGKRVAPWNLQELLKLGQGFLGIVRSVGQFAQPKMGKGHVPRLQRVIQTHAEIVAGLGPLGHVVGLNA